LEPARDRAIRAADRIKAPAARELAGALAATMAELVSAQHALRQREAELSVAVPVVSSPAEQEQFAGRLEAVLKSGSVVVGCQAAGLYLLDESTTELKLRAAWGLPRGRLAEPARRLETALADLEAMLGHAVVLEDTHLLRRWNPPEPTFPAAVCVPVASSTTILGTLWFFCAESRDFDERQTNLIELVAGRLAAELERQALLRDAADNVAVRRQLASVEQFYSEQRRTVLPIVEGWEIAFASKSNGTRCTRFSDWVALSDDRVALLAGCVPERGLPGAALADRLRTAFRAHAFYHCDPAALLTEVDRTYGQMSFGEERLAACIIVLGSRNDDVELATMGSAAAFIDGPGPGFPIGDPGRAASPSVSDELPCSSRFRLAAGQSLALTVGQQPSHVHSTGGHDAILKLHRS
jgi:hypothetical protein